MKTGYKFDFVSATLTITKAFEDKANDPTTEEYRLIQKFRADFPNMKISRNSHSSPSKYHNSNGTTTRRNQFNGLTEKRMLSFINSIPNSKEFLKSYTFLKTNASYTILAKWFMEQFPYYQTNPLFYLDNNDIKVIDFSQYLSNDQKAEKTEAENKAVNE